MATSIWTKRNLARCALTGAGFLADAYDLFVINIVKNVLKEVYPDQTSSDISLITSAALWGAVLGQLLFGSFADYIGRRAIFITTLTLTTLGSILSATCVQNDTFTLYQQLALYQFIMGFGVGGEYPLSATVTSESTAPDVRGRLMALVFSMQGVGNLLASLVMFITLSTNVDKDIAWRIGMGFGAVPGLIGFYFRWKMEETSNYKEAKKHRVSHSQNLKAAMKVYWKPMIGTALSWFILDITFYGNSLFSGTITELMHLGTGSRDNALNSLYVALMAIPGYFLTVTFLEKIGRKPIQFYGFGTISLLYLTLGAFFDDLKLYPALFLMLYGMTFLFSNFGPNATTYLIPGEYYPSEVRATCHGLSAASGKLGAAITAYSFTPLKSWMGIDNVLILCGGVGATGMIVTYFFTPDYSAATLEVEVQSKMEDYRSILNNTQQLEESIQQEKSGLLNHD